MSVVLTVLMSLQAPLSAQGEQLSTPPLQPLRPDQVEAAPAMAPPVLDGIDDDAVWSAARPVSEFLEVRPTEGAVARQRTEGKVAYDSRYLYVFVRAFDTAPDSIVSLLARRDQFTSSDQIGILIDAYHDRRTGVEFMVNPAGVKIDMSVSLNGQEDPAWDAVWDVATQIDELGWTAEFRIPFSQLRFAPAESVTFGFGLWRKIPRYSSDLSWPEIRFSQAGYISQWGELLGMQGLASPRRTELSPYLVSSNEPMLGSGSFDRDQRFTVGGDLKYAVASNLTLNATVNPDFGQVEADPSELNLSAFESFFQERRPFFVEGASLFSMPVNCFVTNDCQTGEGLFYSRRIGRSPTLSGIHGDDGSPTSTRILGAAKLTGRLAGGLSVGFLNATTERVSAGDDRTLEPRTNFSLARVSQDFAAGDGNFGLLLTGVNRSLDEWSEQYLHNSAYAAGFDARRRWGNYEVSGMVSASRVAGSEDAIARTQLNSTHYLNRPGSTLEFDSTRTSLSGYSGEVRFSKAGGDRTRFETGYGRRSAGFEVNDLGFLRQADEQKWSNWMTLRFANPNKIYDLVRVNLNYWMTWNTAGLLTDRSLNGNTHVTFRNQWRLSLGGTVGRIGGAWCDFSCTRGGPAVRADPYIAPWGRLSGDQRKTVVPAIRFNYFRGDGGTSSSLSLSPSVDVKVSSNFTTGVSASHRSSTQNTQWFGNFSGDDGQIHHTFAHLDQTTLAFTWRLAYTFSPEASLQLYAQPFVSKGDYSDIRELVDPGATEYADRFAPYTDPEVVADPGGFNFKQFRSNVVFRWEYNPGSTIFLVWSQGREGFLPMRGNDSFRGDFDQLFGRRANDVFLVKMSYWLNW